MLTTLSLGGLSGRLWAIGRASSKVGKRFRGKKAATEALQRKRQVIDSTMSLLLEEVTRVRAQWSHVQATRSDMEEGRLTSVVARAQLMHRSLAMAMANLESLSIFGLNACDVDMQTASSLLAKLRLEVRVSAARAMSAHSEALALVPTHRLLTA